MGILRNAKTVLAAVAAAIAIACLANAAFCGSAHAASGDHTQAEAVAWLNDQAAHEYKYDDGGGYGCQCVCFAKAYYEWLGYGYARSGNGYDFEWNFPDSGFTRLYGVNPEPGDIVVWRAWVSPAQEYGHVAVCVNGGLPFQCVEQNGSCSWRGAHYSDWYNGMPTCVIRPSFKAPQPSNLQPVGCVDSVSGGTGCVRVTGWAFDPDDSSASLAIHVYAERSEGERLFVGATTANLARADVNSAYGISGNHGFDATLYTTLSGRMTFHVYALDLTGGANPDLDPIKSTYVTADRTAPTITNVKVTEADTTGYTVTCLVRDAGSGVCRVQFPTWTTSGGQDDLAGNWETNGAVSGTVSGTLVVAGDEKGTYNCTFRVSVWDHNNELGDYITHIYAYDNVGNHNSGYATGATVEDTCSYPDEFYASVIHEESGGLIVCEQGGKNVQYDDGSAGEIARKYWHFEKAGGSCPGAYRITNLQNGCCLDAYGMGADDETNIWADADNGGANQRWYIRESGGSATLLAAHCGKALDLYGNRTAPGSNVSLHAANGSAAQRYEIRQETPATLDIAVSEQEYGGHRYEAIDACFSWEQAKTFCEARGGHLVTITSAEENAVVADAITAGSGEWYSIGLRTSANGGSNEWVTGEGLEYSNYATAAFSFLNRGSHENVDMRFYIAQGSGERNGIIYLSICEHGEWLSNYSGAAGGPCGFVCEFEPASADPEPSPTPADPTPAPADPTPAPEAGGGAVRIAGESRYETAAEIALAAYPDGAPGVVVATGANFPDALGASSLAGMLGYPVVLTDRDVLPAAAADAIARLGAGEAVIVGGTSAVSDAVEAALSASCTVTRVWGADRYATARAVYEEGLARGEWGDTCIVATGVNYPDALSISGYAFASRAPIFLADPASGLDAATEAAIAGGGFSRAVVAGGASAVRASDEEWLSANAGCAVRLAGADRYETSARIAEFAIANGCGADGACIATGANFPDALAGSALAGVRRSVMLLASPGNTSALSVLSANAGAVSGISLLGGESAVPASVREAAAAAAGL